MTDRLGQGAYVGLGITAAFLTNGAAADIDVYFRVEGAHDNLNLERDIVTMEDITNEWMDSDLIKAGQRRVTGSLTLKATFEAMQDILRMFTGHNIAPSGVGPWTYSFVPVARNLAAHYWLGTTNRGWTIEVFRGGTGGNSTFYQGCVISEITVKGEQNSFAEITLTFIGRGFTIGAKSVPATYLTDYIFAPSGQSTALLTLEAVTYVVHNFNLTLTAGIDFSFELMGVETLVPLPNGKITAKLEAEIRVADDLFLNRVNTPDIATTGRFSASNILDIRNAGDTHKLAFTFDELVLQSPAEPRASSLGVVTVPLSLEAYSSAIATPAYTVELINSDNAGAYNT